MATEIPVNDYLAGTDLDLDSDIVGGWFDQYGVTHVVVGPVDSPASVIFDVSAFDTGKIIRMLEDSLVDAESMEVTTLTGDYVFATAGREVDGDYDELYNGVESGQPLWFRIEWDA